MGIFQKHVWLQKRPFRSNIQPMVFAVAALLAGCGGGRSHVTASVHGVVISKDKTEQDFIFIPDIFPAERVQYQTQSDLILSSDYAVAKGLKVTRVLNSTTSTDLVDPSVFDASLSTRLSLGVTEVRSRFQYGENLLRLETEGAEGEPGYNERTILLRDFSAGAISLNHQTFSGKSAGQVEAMTGPVQVSAGTVLTTSFIPMVYQ